jgi:hypothetical protein
MERGDPSGQAPLTVGIRGMHGAVSDDDIPADDASEGGASEPDETATAPSPDAAIAADAPSAPATESPPAEKPKVAARLKPAQLLPEELGERAAYAPKIPWGMIAGFVGLVVVFVVVYRARDAARTDGLRSELLATHATELGDLSREYMTFRERLERWTMDANAAGEPERWVDPRLRIAGLHGGDGIYLRVMAEYADTPDGIEGSALSMEEDALTRCLGIAPASARGFYQSGMFLTPMWVDQIREETDLLRLRLYDEQMANAIASDLPVLSTMMSAQYFLLVIQQGVNRRDAPVDVYLWDLREEQQLLRGRFQGRGILIPVRIDSMLPGVDMPAAPPGRPSMTSGGAHDCSIASQIKALTGEAPVAASAGAVGALRAREEAFEAEDAAREAAEAEAEADEGAPSTDEATDEATDEVPAAPPAEDPPAEDPPAE